MFIGRSLGALACSGEAASPGQTITLRPPAWDWVTALRLRPADASRPGGQGGGFFPPWNVPARADASLPMVLTCPPGRAPGGVGGRGFPPTVFRSFLQRFQEYSCAV